MKRQTYSYNPETRRIEWWYQDLGPKAARPAHGNVAPSATGAGSKRSKPGGQA